MVADEGPVELILALASSCNVRKAASQRKLSLGPRRGKGLIFLESKLLDMILRPQSRVLKSTLCIQQTLLASNTQPPSTRYSSEGKAINLRDVVEQDKQQRTEHEGTYA